MKDFYIKHWLISRKNLERQNLNEKRNLLFNKWAINGLRH